ncbi:MAG: hypothetical protein IKQ92_03230 [Clostridia bacterium]|nr:hypothetical protein [Clostridia bacterium]
MKDFGSKIKDFWSENGKTIGKLLLYQFGMTFFGIMLWGATAAAQSQRIWLMLFASGFSTLFYLYLIYSVLWERGGQDRIRVDGGRAEKKPLKGFFIILAANIPNILIALIILVSQPFRGTSQSPQWGYTVNVVGRSLALLWEAMYAGVVATFSPKNPIIHVLDILPALFVGTAAYLLGLNNKRLVKLFELKQPGKKEPAKLNQPEHSVKPDQPGTSDRDE